MSISKDDRTAVYFLTAWKAFKSCWSVFTISMLVLFASWVALELAVFALHRFGIFPWIFLHLAFLLSFSGLMVGLHGMALQSTYGKAPELRHLTCLFARGPNFLLAFCIYTVAVVGGLVILVVPGVYVAVRYALFGQIFASRPATALEALRDASTLSHGRWWSLCGALLMALAINLFGAALLGVGLLITFPVTLLAISGLYRSLQRPSPSLKRRPPLDKYASTSRRSGFPPGTGCSVLFH
ncbi:MAG: hypothetical protein HY043_10040 [Verrucomicrobia bacterium]|nr:hypothetical protein [Verrucomicrobiota bacterium]